MLWVWILIGIAVIGVLVVAGLAWRLWHQASDVMGEVTVLAGRLGEIGDLLGRLDLAPLEGKLEGEPVAPNRGRVTFAEDPYAEDDRIAADESTAAPRPKTYDGG